MPATVDVYPSDYYQVLGVGKNSSHADINKAYRKLKGKHHPLLWNFLQNKGSKEKAEEEFRLLSEAYAVLGDPEKRMIYDQERGRAGQRVNNHQSGDDNSVFEVNGSFGGTFGRDLPKSHVDGSRDRSRPASSRPANGGSGATPQARQAPSWPTNEDIFDMDKSIPRSAAVYTPKKERSLAIPVGAEVVVNTQKSAFEFQRRYQGMYGHVLEGPGTEVGYEGLYHVELHEYNHGLEDRANWRRFLPGQRGLTTTRTWLNGDQLTQIQLITVTGITSQTAQGGHLVKFNGKRGKIRGYDYDLDTYTVRMSQPGLVIRLTSSHVILPCDPHADWCDDELHA